MKLFDCKVRLKGSLLNEVQKHNVTAAEIVILRAIHGNDAVLDIQHTANVNRSDSRERTRLAAIYSHTTQQGVLAGPDLVSKFLGIASQPLVDDVPVIEDSTPVEDEQVPDEPEEIVELSAPVITRTRVPKAAKPADLTA